MDVTNKMLFLSLTLMNVLRGLPGTLFIGLFPLQL